MEDRPPQSVAKAGTVASPSVAQLAGRFQEQAAAKETPASKPTRRKPPCSLPLFPPKLELGQNGEEKASPSVNHGPKVKVKSSPLIEKLQASLAFDPTALLPGASPKSPGLKTAVSPFQSPPSTPSSPGVWPRASEPEEVPVSFDQPPEGSHLPCFNKVRTRGSIKRRPPSRRFRRSQSDFGDLANTSLPEPAQENGTEENGDAVFPATTGSPDEGLDRQEAREKSGSLEALPVGRTPRRTEAPKEKATATHTALHPELAGPTEAAEAPPTPNPEAEKGPSSLSETEQPGQAAETPEEDEAPGQGAVQEEDPPKPPGAGEGGPSPEQGGPEKKQEEGSSPEGSGETATAKDHAPAKDADV